MKGISGGKGGEERLLQGNEAIARGALEAGVSFCAGYPGNPSSEIIETLAEAAKDLPFYAEWSVNEKVALEAATAASFSGCRALASMKQNGVNVVSDFLTNLTLSGTKGGLLLVSCDDPSAISSTNEEDSRFFARVAEIPLLEPATPQEALDMTRWAFELSETLENVVMLRSVSRLSHTRANVRLADLPRTRPRPFFETGRPFHTFPVVAKHMERKRKLERAAALFEASPFNAYEGPETCELLVIASGSPWHYAVEAVELLGLGERVGVVKLGTTFPLPKGFIERHLQRSPRVLFLEEVESFIEDQVKALTADRGEALGTRTFLGKASGAVPSCGELHPGMVMDLLARLLGLPPLKKGEAPPTAPLPARDYGFCAGCPHRGSLYAIKSALTRDGRQGFVSGDIGCYSLGLFPTGFSQIKSVHAMGSGIGLSCGYGKLGPMGFDQPVVTLCGDSTFFHAALPGLVNARFNQSDILMVILDNSATAMTGFQPHPGTGHTALGVKTEIVDIGEVCRALGLKVVTGDPYAMEETAQTLYALMQESGPRVLILKRKCALVQGREGGFPFAMEVDPSTCLGESCGCGRFCTRIFRCPGLIWDRETSRARIDGVICVGCGICADICPQGAIVRKEKA